MNRTRMGQIRTINDRTKLKIVFYVQLMSKLRCTEGARVLGPAAGKIREFSSSFLHIAKCLWVLSVGDASNR